MFLSEIRLYLYCYSPSGETEIKKTVNMKHIIEFNTASDLARKAVKYDELFKIIIANTQKRLTVRNIPFKEAEGGTEIDLSLLENEDLADIFNDQKESVYQLHRLMHITESHE